MFVRKYSVTAPLTGSPLYVPVKNLHSIEVTSTIIQANRLSLHSLIFALAWKLDDETDAEWAERSKRALKRLSGLSTDTIFFIDLQEEPEPRVLPGKDPRLFPRHLNEDGSRKTSEENK